MITFVLNGSARTWSGDPSRSLLRVLREDFGLTGAKQGCGQGLCGSCAVLAGDKVLMACHVPVSRIAGQMVTTVEGIGSPENPHPVQTAFVRAGAVQCGFCTPGMIIRAKWLLDRNPVPSREDIVEAFQAHLCRCTGYAKIISAVQAAAAVIRGEASFNPILLNNPVGRAIPRRDSPAKAAGTEKFAADRFLQGMLYLKVLRSPYPHALIRGIKTAAASAEPGIAAVFTAADVAGTNRLKISRADQPIICDQKVRCTGDPVAVVAAVSEELAAMALQLIEVDYELLPAVFNPFEALEEGAPQVHADSPNLLAQHALRKGDPSAAPAAASVEQDFTTPYIEHAYLEPDAGTAWLDREGTLVIAAGSQNIHHDRKNLAEALGLTLEQIRIIQTPTGGAFGGKLDISVQGILGLAALKLRSPVSLVYTREETHGCTSKRHPFNLRCRLGADPSGALTALEMDLTANTGAYATFGKSVMTRALVHATGPYRIPNVRIDGKVVFTNGPVSGAMRGFGVPQVIFAIESMLDMLAEKLGIDPLELRLKNAYRQGDSTATGQLLDHPIGLAECLKRLQPAYSEALDWARFGGGQVKRGVGIAAMWFGPGKSPPDEAQAHIELTESGTVRLYIGAADIGQGSDTVFGQIAAQELGLPFDAVEVTSNDTVLTPDAGYSSGSRQTYISGGAVQAAAAKLKRVLLERAAVMLGVSSSQLCCSGGYVYRQAAGKPITAAGRFPVEIPRVSLSELSRQGLSGCRFTGVRRAEISQLDSDTGEGIPYETFSFGVQMAQVEVDTDTLGVKVKRIVAVHDSGTPLNPLALEGQIEGGIVMGLGYALSEEYVPGKTGNFSTYRIPRFKDAPEIAVLFVDVPRPKGPYGASAAGECALVPTAPAIANAVYNACKLRIYSLPITKERLQAKLRSTT